MSDRSDLLDDGRLTAFGLLMEVQGAVAARCLAQIAEHGLSPSEFEVLLRLSRSPGGRLRMSDLAAQALLSSSGLTRLVDRLEQADLVTRSACPTDKRGSFAQVTAAGAERMTAALPGHLAVIEELYTGALSPSELTALTATLRRLRDHVRPAAAVGADDDAVSPA